MNRRTRFVYGGLLFIWVALTAWQVGEHTRVRQAEKTALINRARDISTTVGVVLRSQRRFGVISQDRIESALSALVHPDELTAVALLNAAGEIVASAGAAINFELKGLVPKGEHWDERSVTLMNLVDLGTNMTAEAQGPRPTIVLGRGDLFNPFGTNRPPPGTNYFGPPPPPGADGQPFDPRRGPPPGGGGPPAEARSQAPPNEGGPPLEARPPGSGGGPRPRGEGRPPFGRPFWMSPEDYQAALEKKGIHSFVMVLSAQSVISAVTQDLWLRLTITGLATVAVFGLGLAWRNMVLSADLEVRLVRAAELNTRLKEMNLAAAGLAHETRNPLNLIRGLAHMISKRADAPPEVQQKTREIMDETDRVTAQLNEFINYSRPREVRRTAVALNAAVNEVVRALNADFEDKAIRLEIAPDLPTIEADEQLLRQALFNLLMNAAQAVDRGGLIQVVAEKTGPNAARLDIKDNGPGVPPERRAEVFKPYFTTHARGTGLGLAVVQQIVLAHGWEIACLANEPRGALFRLTHLRVIPGA